MSLFMWQDDIIDIARLIDGYLEGAFTSAGPPMGTRHLISPESAGKDVTVLLVLYIDVTPISPLLGIAESAFTISMPPRFLNLHQSAVPQ